MAPYEIDRGPDGSVWIGLILLTEQNVGLSFLPRIAPWNSFTHHGVNVRTYVKGPPSHPKPQNTNSSQNDNDHDGYSHNEDMNGIHFASLECDHRFVSHMANCFGMPYRVATMFRSYELKTTARATTKMADENDSAVEAQIHKFRLVSKRSRDSNSILHVLFSKLWDKIPLHTTKLLEHGSQTSSNAATAQVQNKKEEPTFTVECEWERTFEPVVKSELATFLVERYHAYTYKYGTRLRGTIKHEPWPVELAKLKRLSIQNVACYEPQKMQPVIDFMASHSPESILFSPGVDPIDFEMLQPI